MKLFLKTVAAITLGASISMAGTSKMTCKTQIENSDHYGIGNLNSIELSAVKLDHDRLENIVATATYVDYNDAVVSVTARRDLILKDEKYKPRKYKDHARYQLSQLITVDKFSNFLPGDDCEINMMIPLNAPIKGTFNAPAVINCDQSGGKAMFECSIK